MLSELIVDGNAVTTASSYTFENVTSNHTITATFSPIRYTIKYNGNGATSGSMSDSSHTYGVAKTLTTNSFSRTGYNFLGWSTSSSIATVTYTDGQNISNLTTTNGATVNLYAVWGDTLVLATPKGTPINTDELSVSVNGVLGSGSGDIIYKLYVGGTYKSTVTGASGKTVTLNATGLTANTTYNCYVLATSKINSAVTATSSTVSVKTYACMGDTYQCTLPTSACSTCGGWGEIGSTYTSEENCTFCNATTTHIVSPNGCYGYCSVCTIAGYGPGGDGHRIGCNKCYSCNGAVYLKYGNLNWVSCQHGKNEAHTYCSHGEFGPHY